MGKDQYNFRAKLAKNLRAIRGDSNQKDFAKKLGISQSTLARIESEQQNVSIDMLELICKRLRCQLSEIL